MAREVQSGYSERSAFAASLLALAYSLRAEIPNRHVAHGHPRNSLANVPRTPLPSWLSVRRAASATIDSQHVHAWLHWPKLSANRNTNRGRGHAIVRRLHKVSGQCRATSFACVPQPNCRFNADKNAPHFCRLTWALGFSQTQALNDSSGIE